MVTVPYLIQTIIVIFSIFNSDVIKEEKISEPQRIICYVSRGVLSYGELIKETKKNITIKTLTNEVKTLDKSTIHRIDRLSKSNEHPEVELLLRNGLKRRGKIKKEDWYKIILITKGAKLTFDRSKVLQIKRVQSFDEKYATLEPYVNYKDPEDVLQFAKWLSKEKKHKLAIVALNRIPENKQTEEIRTLMKLEVAREKLENNDLNTSVKNDDPPPTSIKSKDKIKQNILSDNDINLIRFYELNFDLDQGLKIEAKKSVVKDIIKKKSSSGLVTTNPERHKELVEMSAHEIAQLLIDLRLRDLYNDINVTDDPSSIRAFRNNLHNKWLINRCATNDCHGNPNLGGFYLVNARKKSTQTVYQNFLNIRKFKNKDGLRIINLEQPSLSRLLQAGLPIDLAVYPHPIVKKWKPIFKSMADPEFISSQSWLQRMMRGLEKPYPISTELNLPQSSNENSLN